MAPISANMSPTPEEEENGEQADANGDNAAAEDDDGTPASSFSWPKNLAPVSDEALSVLSNTHGFILLPANTDRIGHYFEAPSEEIRNV